MTVSTENPENKIDYFGISTFGTPTLISQSFDDEGPKDAFAAANGDVEAKLRVKDRIIKKLEEELKNAKLETSIYEKLLKGMLYGGCNREHYD